LLKKYALNILDVENSGRVDIKHSQHGSYCQQLLQ